jgi:GNAT superfamily N-acetyltransferase
VDQQRYRFIEQLTERHINDLHTLYQGEWWTKGRTLEETHRVVAGSQRAFGISRRDDDELVAFARVLTDGVFKAVIFDVIVAPHARRSGLGHALLARIIHDPQLSAVRHLELYCRPELMPYYEQLGFSAHLPEVRFMRLG